MIQGAREDMRLDVAMVWLFDTQSVDVRVYANTVRNDGGVHLDGFLAGLEDFFGARGLHRPMSWSAGILVLCNVSVPREQYRNPTKSVLANPDVAPFVREVVAGALESWANDNPDIAAELRQRMKWRQIADS